LSNPPLPSGKSGLRRKQGSTLWQGAPDAICMHPQPLLRCESAESKGRII